jgi:hypothetical protein
MLSRLLPDQWRWVAIACCSTLIAGCGPTGGAATVSGKVTLDGASLTKGTVTFHDAQTGALANGEIGPDGRYELMTAGQRGLSPGEYRVTVTAADLPKLDQSTRPSQNLPKLLVPAKYTAQETSGLSYTVKPGSNAYDIPLKSD